MKPSKAPKKLRAWLHRPFAQLLILVMLVGASSDATERFAELLRDGELFTMRGLLALAWSMVVVTLAFMQWDRIEARMKRGDRID